MNEDDFIYYKDDKNNLMSGGFSMNLLALKNGLSPLSGIEVKGGGEVKGGSEDRSLHDTDYSQEFKDHIIPSFLHYQLAGEHDNYSQKMSELLNVYEDDNEQNDENEDQEGGDLYEKLLDLVTMNKSNKNKNKNKNKISRKEPKINKNTKNNKKTKKNKKQKDKN